MNRFSDVHECMNCMGSAQNKWNPKGFKLRNKFDLKL